MLSLATNPACLLMDDELNVLPTSSHVRNPHTCIFAITQALSSRALSKNSYSRPLLLHDMHRAERRCETSGRCRAMTRAKSW